MELPAGLCDEGEQPAETIRREAVEEAGLHADRLEPIGDFLLSPGGCDEHTALFAGRITAPEANADGIAGSAGLAAEHEDIRIHVVPAAAAIAAALDGAYPNVITTVALLWLAAKRGTLRENWTKT
jgi:ADP-ribose pyrophosphatase